MPAKVKAPAVQANRAEYKAESVSPVMLPSALKNFSRTLEWSALKFLAAEKAAQT